MNTTMFVLGFMAFMAFMSLGGPAAAAEWSKGYRGYGTNGAHFAPYRRLDSNAAGSDGQANQQAAGPRAAHEGHRREAFSGAFPGARLQGPYRSNRSDPYSWWK